MMGDAALSLPDEAPPATSAEPTIQIVRATARMRLEPWRLVEGEKHDSEKCGGVKAGCSACALWAALRAAQSHAARAANVAIRAHVREDTAALDAFVIAHGRMPAKGDAFMWPAVELRADGSSLPRTRVNPKTGKTPSGVYTYNLVRAAAPMLPSSTSALIQHRVDGDWRKRRFECLIRQISAPPHYKDTMPLPLSARAIRLVRDCPEEEGEHEGARYVLSCSLAAGTHPNGYQFRVPIVARDKRQAVQLAALAEGCAHAATQQAMLARQRMAKKRNPAAAVALALPGLPDGAFKLGDAMIEPDGNHWYLRVSYTAKAPAPTKSERVAGINRGLCSFVAAVTYTGEDWIEDGAAIIATLKQFQRRRREYQNGVISSNRVGHGLKRTLKPIEHLEGVGHRWRVETCKNIASRFVRWLIDRGISRLYVENLTGIRRNAFRDLGRHIGQLVQTWPYFLIQQHIVSLCEASGIDVVLVASEHISQRCPSCGHIAPENMDLAHRSFRCVRCKWTRHLDVAAAMNVVDRGERLGDVATPVGAREAETQGDRGAKRPRTWPGGRPNRSAHATARNRGRKGAW